MSVMSRRTELLLLMLILLLAGWLRLWQLDRVPPGLTHDEADTGYFVAAVYRGTPSQIKAPYGYANEAFTMYSGALFMALFGPTDLALRLHSACFGLLMLVFGYVWTRRAFDAPTALGATALAAVTFWPVATSRFALNPQPAPALFTGAVWCLWLALFDQHPPRRRWWGWLGFALLLAGSLWAYEVARATSAALFAFVFYLLLTDRPRMRERGGWFVGALALGMALAAPHLLDPAAWQRSGTLSTTLKALAAGHPRPLLDKTIEALGTFTFRGDPFITYNPPGRPIFDGPTGLLFYGGLFLCVKRWRQPAPAFTLLWIATGLLPSMVVGAWNSTLHSMGMQFVVFAPPALMAVETARWLGRRYGTNVGYIVAALFVALVSWTAIRTCRDYFERWGQSPQVRAAYFHNLAAVTDYLNATTLGDVAAISSPFPDLPHDPFIADLRVQRDDLTLRWFDARRALLFPAADTTVMILPTNAPLDAAFAQWLPPASGQRIVVHPEDIDPYFDVWTWSPQASWQRVTEQLASDGHSLTPPVNFGRAVALLGYFLPTPVIRPGETVTLITAWQIMDPTALGPVSPQHYGRSAAVFAHLLTPEGQVVGQEDRLDVPAWNWQSGDRFLQIHRFTPDSVLSAGVYPLEVGIYTQPDLIRLPALAGNEVTSDHVRLQPVEVKAP